MTQAFLCLIRGPAPDLLANVGAYARPGDQVIILDDSGDAQALTRLQTHAMATGWPVGVTVDTVITGTTAHLGLRCQIGLSRVTADRVIILNGHTRLTPAFTAARDVPAKVVVGDRCVLEQIVFSPDAIPAWQANDDPLALGLMWGLSRHESLCRTAGFSDNDACIGGGLFDAVQGLVEAQPEALPWVMAQLPDWVADMGPGAALTALGHTADFVAALPENMDFEPEQRLFLDRIGGDFAAKRQAMRPATPQVIGQAKAVLHLAGKHANRTPFSYAELGGLWAEKLRFSDNPAAADLVIYAHPRDLENAAPEVQNTRKSLALVSEEPFWDSLFSPDPLAENIALPMAGQGMVNLTQINHHTSAIFDFDHIPYYLLTNARFITAYRRMFARNAGLSAEDWKTAFMGRKADVVFMAERRTETFHDIEIKDGNIVGLCAWRTRLAQDTLGRVERRGASWQGGKTRQQLTDWHADKLAEMDGYTRILSAVENTHQPTYLSEKLFDAFACGARPLYCASDAHLMQTLCIPDAAWINLYGMTSGAAAKAVADTPWDDGFYASFALAQQQLAKLFHDDAKIAAERGRLQVAVLAEIERIV